MLRIIYRILQSCAQMVGYELSFTRKLLDAPSSEYEVIRTSATYAPWLGDQSFIDAYKVVQPYTLVSKYRCFELWQLVDESKKVPGALIEVGVWKGGSGALIAHRAKMLGITDPVYLCDTFTGVVKAGTEDSRYIGGEHADTSTDIVSEVLKKLSVPNARILTGVFPEETSDAISETSFRLCHIDVDVYQSAKDVFEWVWPRLSVGGIVVFDDYGFKGCDGVTRLGNDLRRNDNMVFVYNLNGHALCIKTK